VTATAPAPVLVADDDYGVRTTVVEILRRAGYQVLEAPDGQSALATVRQQQVGLIVLDIRMPVLDGVSVLDALDDPPAVLLVSAFSVDPETRARVGPKVFRYLRKPVPPGQLLEVVAEALTAASGT
jgi:two-component system response regulator PrrA